MSVLLLLKRSSEGVGNLFDKARSSYIVDDNVSYGGVPVVSIVPAYPTIIKYSWECSHSESSIMMFPFFRIIPHPCPRSASGT